jgi:hypothetical protein
MTERGINVGALLDAAEPAHGVQRSRCAVCGADRSDLLWLVHAARDTEVLCTAHRDGALLCLGPPRPMPAPQCSGCGAHEVVAQWPARTLGIDEPAIFACRSCFAGSVAALAAEHSEPTIEEHRT